MIRKTLGGKRLGDGGGMQVEMHEWGKSTHDLSEKLKTSMGIGTLVPFYNTIILPGDEVKANVYADLISKPTNGPLFGSFKFQADFFFAPHRLYIAKLHNNKLNLAMNMKNVYLPQIEITANNNLDFTKPLDNQQINSSSLMAYLGIRGVGLKTDMSTYVSRLFNADAVLAYFDIHKNYYANTQEDKAYFIHHDIAGEHQNITVVHWQDDAEPQPPFTGPVPYENTDYRAYQVPLTREGCKITFTYAGADQSIDNLELIIQTSTVHNPNGYFRIPITEVFEDIDLNPMSFTITCQGYKKPEGVPPYAFLLGWGYANFSGDVAPKLKEFDLDNIDKIREILLKSEYDVKITKDIIFDAATPIGQTPEPLQSILLSVDRGDKVQTALENNQEGLLVKTYQADIFNAWIKTDLVTQLQTASAVQVTSNQFTIDQLNLAKKTWEHLNRLVASKGTYRDFIEVAYGVRNLKDFEIPIYLGGLSKKIVFQEIISNADTEVKPLASIAGKATFAGETKGGYFELEAEESGVLLGIMSITPYIDYTQGNAWHRNLQNIDELHKPAFDGLGYQDNLTDQFAWFDTKINGLGQPIYKSAGKVPAWINYMTSYNRALGTLAESEQWLVLSRRYESSQNGITDLTTYIDPAKFNYIWADARRDAQNFWVEIFTDITIRRVMSAKQIPTF